jgi:hypothetical protein
MCGVRVVCDVCVCLRVCCVRVCACAFAFACVSVYMFVCMCHHEYIERTNAPRHHGPPLASAAAARCCASGVTEVVGDRELVNHCSQLRVRKRPVVNAELTHQPLKVPVANMCVRTYPYVGRQRHRRANRQTGRHRDRHAARQSKEQTDRQTDRQADRQKTERHTDRQTDTQTADRQTDGRTDRQTGPDPACQNNNRSGKTAPQVPRPHTGQLAESLTTTG